MYIPASQTTPDPEHFTHWFADHFNDVESWSSTIGVVTAICGNILISFALNTQRYAHMRLSSDREEVEEKQKARRRRRKQKIVAGYGTQQEDVAEQRAKANNKSEPERYTLDRDAERGGAESDPLIPAVDTNSLSTVSEETDGQENDDASSTREKSYLKSPIWWAGIAMMTTGEAGNFIAYGFAPASLVSPLGVVALISNCLIAPWLLQEKFRWRDGVGVLIAIAGCVIVVLSSSDSNPKLDPDDIWDLITRWEFETYFAITVTLMAILAVLSNKYGRRTILIDLGLVALLGGYTALSTKGVASLLSNTIWRVVTFPITYFLAAILVFTAVMQIKYVNRALQHFNATMVIPTQFVLFTISVIVGSAILYRDFERTTGQDAAIFIGGCALTFVGVWCITSGRGDESLDNASAGGDEDAINLLDEEGAQPEIREREDDVNTSRRRSLIMGSHKHTPELRPIPEPETPEIHLYSSNIQPANVAAIHSQSITALPQGSSEEPTKPRMHATTSAPVVPSASTASSTRPKTPLNRGVSGPSGQPSARNGPSTPTSRQLSVQPPDSPGPQRLTSRHSIVGILPSPLTSPLSSSLTAIVADSLRRGSSTRRRTARSRRNNLGLDGRDTIHPAAVNKRHSIASGELDLYGEAEEEVSQQQQSMASGSQQRPANRMRSLSAALGDIFRSRTQSQDEGSQGAQDQRTCD